MAEDWKATLNLPKTSFPQKANLTQREPELLRKWQEEDLYGKIIASRKGRPPFAFHDGPPYANGHIHLGHALNKILKDIVVKSKTMQGFLVAYRPGWDCHGLPIETAIEKEKGRKVRNMENFAFRGACRDYAEKYIRIQREEFIRLGVFGDWKNPYRTMDYSYEATIARSFADCFKKGYVYKGMKPVLWCAHCETALAEAEVEYADHTSPSIYVRFPPRPGQEEKLPEGMRAPNTSVVIWTTTPWTLPANLAVAFHPKFEYVALKTGDETLVVGKELLEAFRTETGIEGEVVDTFKGADLEGILLGHPFLDRDSLCVLADYVTTEQGTGCVHTAPGHGQEDYVTGQRYGLEVISPVDHRGCFEEDTPLFGGLQVFEANPKVLEVLREEKALVALAETEHSYPHCWRCKKPLIFRATQQWFISMKHEKLRERTLEAIDKVSWVPPWGRNRIYGMVENRPDWCISRQRRWGVPITILTCSSCSEPVRDPSFFDRVHAEMEERGAGIWMDGEPERFLPEGYRCEKCGGESFERETDILDVWFDSGVSHRAIMGHDPEMPWPSEIYLEGSDQHRGWFHTSLLTSMIMEGEAPYHQVITHGFTLDGEGKAMSKSMGNVISPNEVVKKFGAEILRLWVSMVDYRDDVKFSWDLVQKNSEAYRKIRNTIRYLMSNLYDFEPGDALPVGELRDIDRYVMILLDKLIHRVTKAYEDYAFHIVYHDVLHFCSVTLSAFYLDILKDRLYCYPAGSHERRSAQTVLFHLLDSLTRLLTPILPFTSEEAWAHIPGEREESVHMARLPEPEGIHDPDLVSDWDKLKEYRDRINKCLEEARQEQVIGKSLEAELILRPEEKPLMDILRRYEERLPVLFIVSGVELAEPEEGRPPIEVARAGGEKCVRCWTFTREPVDHDSEPLCPRCSDAVS